MLTLCYSDSQQFVPLCLATTAAATAPAATGHCPTLPCEAVEAALRTFAAFATMDGEYLAQAHGDLTCQIAHPGAAHAAQQAAAHHRGLAPETGGATDGASIIAALRGVSSSNHDLVSPTNIAPPGDQKQRHVSVVQAMPPSPRWALATVGMDRIHSVSLPTECSAVVVIFSMGRAVPVRGSPLCGRPLLHLPEAELTELYTSSQHQANRVPPGAHLESQASDRRALSTLLAEDSILVAASGLGDQNVPVCARDWTAARLTAVHGYDNEWKAAHGAQLKEADIQIVIGAQVSAVGVVLLW